jgi:gamma-glutamyl:cysteine ligase YbdK (ATP-grasp superfamily)
MSIQQSSGNQLSGLATNEILTPISELPNYLKRWLALQDEIAALSGELSQRRTQSKALKEIILRIMNSNKVAALNTNKGTVLHKTRDAAERISNDYLLKHCKDFFNGDDERAQALVKYLEEHRTVIKKHDLKLQITRSDDDKLSRRS